MVSGALRQGISEGLGSWCPMFASLLLFGQWDWGHGAAGIVGAIVYAILAPFFRYLGQRYIGNKRSQLEMLEIYQQDNQVFRNHLLEELRHQRNDLIQVKAEANANIKLNEGLKAQIEDLEKRLEAVRQENVQLYARIEVLSGENLQLREKIKSLEAMLKEFTNHNGH
jgi:uncharacterized membrane protein YhiD involved in acid resistance